MCISRDGFVIRLQQGGVRHLVHTLLRKNPTKTCCFSSPGQAGWCCFSLCLFSLGVLCGT
jgi:hypothetical protein